jgi:transcription initiation factor TFIID subunit TAF12
VAGGLRGGTTHRRSNQQQQQQQQQQQLHVLAGNLFFIHLKSESYVVLNF